MTIVEDIQAMREIIQDWKHRNSSIGFVPTMGFLHEGHASLIRKARKQNDKVVVSIFVNPTQFGPNEDFENYPRNMENDTQQCDKEEVDLIFAPCTKEMYPDPTYAFVDINQLGNSLCGATRPGHFRGVCTVVNKLFNIVMPDRAYFGEKDAQQLVIIQQMVHDLSIPVQIVPCPIVREKDGLAMSSRNSTLSPQERTAARVLSKSLELANNLMMQGETSASVIRSQMKEKIQLEPLATVEYIEIVDAQTLTPLENVKGDVLIALAVKIGNTRLIDNYRTHLEAI
ncbi:MAG: pantoate--beta-alanine ligase [Caldisericia bacterium]|nr:pantoate--beta-alanine ligase [Caldisericia bacterium]MDD4614486.1 pantoate--beta-alanine ligase [Caldisericia bacterium]